MKFVRFLSCLIFCSVFTSQMAVAGKGDPCTDNGDLKGWAKSKLSSGYCEPAPVNTAPTVVITAPEYGAVIPEGQLVTFRALATDNEEGDLSGNVSWSSSVDGSISGSTQLSVGTHTIEAIVRDSNGATGSDSVMVQVAALNTAPVVSIQSPVNGATLTEGDPVTLVASAIDREDGDISADVKWTSTLDGTIRSGDRLVAGTHTIKARLLDSNGAYGSDTVQITVVAANNAPEVAIVSPASGTVIDEGTALTLSAQASDSEQGDLSASVTWSSSLDGNISSPAMLSAGDHLLTATVVDSAGAVDQASVSVTVHAANTAPVVSIQSPANGATITEGDPVTLVASAIDREDGDISAEVKWTSDLDGTISSGDRLVVGTHTIKARLLDSNGAYGSDTVQVTVVAANTAPEVSIVSPASGTVIDEGTALTLSAQASDTEQGDLSASVTWSSSLDGSISSPAMLSPGDHVLTATVVDDKGVMDQATVSVTVNTATSTPVSSTPVVTILAPLAGATIMEGDPVTLAASAIDKEDGDISDQVRWTSTLDGTIRDGDRLVVGTHTIKARLRDSDGEYGSDTVQVTVVAANADMAPVVSILSPSDNSAFGEGVSISLSASASDAEDGDLTNQITWTSSLDGVLASPATLSEGMHTLTATVQDSAGQTRSDSVTVNITGVNNGPVISILLPADGDTVMEGTSLMLTADASDQEDGDLSQQVVWTSSLDGEIANVTTLSVGEHLITASVTDSQGVVATADLYLTVTASDQVARSLTISWVAPTERSDGEPLYPENLRGYEIRVVNSATGNTRVIDLADGLATTYTTEPMLPGTYELSLRAYDNQNIYSDRTAPITATISGL
jgi:hypothetical protein